MMIRNAHLSAYELEALLEALRRDLRMEQVKVTLDPPNATLHMLNVRMLIRLLEALLPRDSQRRLWDQEPKASIPPVHREAICTSK